MASTPTKLPAFRIAAGMTVRHERRACTVINITPVAFYSRNRNRPIPADRRHGVTLTLRTIHGNAAYRTITLHNTDLVTIAR